MGTSYVPAEYTEAFATAVPTPQETAKMEGEDNISSLVQGCALLFQTPQGTPTGSHGPVAYLDLAPGGSMV